MAAPRTIITSARYGLAYQPRTGIAVAGYPVMYKRIVCVLGYPPYVAGTVVSELLRRHSGDIRVIWWRTTVTIEIYDQNNLTEKAKITSNDEIGVLASGFNSFTWLIISSKIQSLFLYCISIVVVKSPFE